MNLKLNRNNKEKKEVNRKILFSEEMYRIIFEESNDIIFSLDENFNFITVNKAVKRHLKINPGDLISKNLTDIIYEEDEKQVVKQFIDEKLADFSRDRNPVTFKVELKTAFISEPREFHIRLEYIDIKGNIEIFGKASSVQDDTLLKCLVSERQKLKIGNYLTTAEEISHRITRNLNKYIDSKEANLLRIALREMIINAIEHGNLGITFEEKSKSMIEDNYFAFVAERQKNPEYSGRQVEIEYSINSKRAVYKITDEGEGFDYIKILNDNPENSNLSMLAHGRGISMAKNVFDEIKFNRKGNQVLLVKRFK